MPGKRLQLCPGNPPTLDRAEGKDRKKEKKTRTARGLRHSQNSPGSKASRVQAGCKGTELTRDKKKNRGTGVQAMGKHSEMRQAHENSQNKNPASKNSQKKTKEGKRRGKKKRKKPRISQMSGMDRPCQAKNWGKGMEKVGRGVPTGEGRQWLTTAQNTGIAL